jgi:hypothetical protein
LGTLEFILALERAGRRDKRNGVALAQRASEKAFQRRSSTRSG